LAIVILAGVLSVLVASQPAATATTIIAFQEQTPWTGF
jgi:hypothetical protein